MIVLINAISIKEGGSLVVLRHLLRQFVLLRPDVSWHVAVNELIGTIPELSLPSVVAHVFPGVERTPWHVNWWYNRTLPALIREIHADVLFSQTNYLPAVQVNCPALLLVQHAGHFSKLFNGRMKNSLSFIEQRFWSAKRRWVVRSVKKAARVTVQTEALATAIMNETGLESGQITVIPHGPGQAVQVEMPRSFPGERSWNLGYTSKFGVQKNFDILFEAVALLLQSGKDLHLHLTLDPALPHNRDLLAKAEMAGIKDVVINHGEIGAQQIKELYDQIDLFVFPSLCESFGFPLLEAMAHGIPLLASDIASNREIIGSDRFVFDGCSATDLAGKATILMEGAAYREASAYMLQRSICFSWERAAERTLQVLCELVEGSTGREAA